MTFPKEKEILMLRNDLLYLSAAAIALAAAARPAAGQAVAPPPAPADVQVPAGNTAYLKGYASWHAELCLPADRRWPCLEISGAAGDRIL